MLGFIYTVKEKQEVIIETFGQYKKTVQQPGLHFKIPFLQKIAMRIPMSQSQIEEKLETKTKDDIFVGIPIKMQMRIADSKKFRYETNNADPETLIKTHIIAAVKQETSQMDFAELYRARTELSERVKAEVGPELLAQYGIQLDAVIIDEPQAPDAIQIAYNKVKASVQEAAAQINRAEADKKAAILHAEGERERLRLQGLGVAEQRGAVIEKLAHQFNDLAAQGMPPEVALKMVTETMRQDTLRDMASHGNLIVTASGSVGDSLADIEAAKSLTKAKQAANENGGTAAKKPAAPAAPGQ